MNVEDRAAPGGRGAGCDFSLRHYRELLDAAVAGGYRFAGFDRPPAPGDLILRHDVDLSLAAAVALAEVEAAGGAWSTWFLMTRSVFYNLDSAEGEAAIARLRQLGGRIAQHAVWPDPRPRRALRAGRRPAQPRSHRYVRSRWRASST